MFFIFLLINFFFKNQAFCDFFLFYCLNKNLIRFFSNFLTNKFFVINFFAKKFIVLNKKFKKFNSVKFKSLKASRRRLRFYLKLKNSKKTPFYPYIFFLHKFFLKKLKDIKNNAIFLTHRKISNFSNFLIVNTLVNPNTSYFYFKNIPLLKQTLSSQKLTFNQKNKINTRRLKIKFFSKKFKKNNIYHFLENNEYRFNKEKNFYFINSHYLNFTHFNRKLKKKKKTKKTFNKFKFIKSFFTPLFVKKFKKTTFLFKALFKYIPKKFLKAKQLTFGCLRPRPYFFLWNELKLNYFDIWLKIKPQLPVINKLFKKLKFTAQKHLRRKFKNIASPRVSPNLSSPSKLFYYRPVLITTILFTSKWRAFFLVENLGFFFLSISEFSNFNLPQNLANFRKELYSFTMKNELQKKLLKKYFLINNIEYYGAYFDKLDVFLSKIKKNTNDLFFSYNFFKFFLTDILKSPQWGSYNIKKNFWNYENIEDMDLTIKRVRFKPGYSIIWREARTVLKSILNVNFKYQHRLTKYLLKFRKIVKFKLILISDMNFLNLMLKTKFSPDFTTSLFFFKNGFIFLNYKTCTNENLQIFTGDFIQLTITCKYYLMYKNLIGIVLKKKRKLDIISKKKSFVPSNPEEKKRTNNYPKWVLQNKNLLEDIPKFLELDFYTLSCFVLYEPFLWSEISTADLLYTKFGIINIYNWKYIN